MSTRHSNEQFGEITGDKMLLADVGWLGMWSIEADNGWLKAIISS